MTAKRRRPQGGRPSDRRPRGPRTADHDDQDRLRAGRVPGTTEFELVYPRCVHQRKEDLAEVRKMIDSGEIEIAADELLWLVDQCRALLEVHQLLGEIALSDGDLELARAHLGYAYDMACKALPKDGLPGTLPYARPSNRAFFEAGKGLAWCLDQLGEKPRAADIVRQLLALDPSDPLNLAAVLPPPS